MFLSERYIRDDKSGGAMFFDDGIIYRSDIISDKNVMHGFSTRLGGVSTHPYTREMNLAAGRCDSDDIVIKNIDIFANAISGGKYGAGDAVCAPQIHSVTIREINASNKGEGVLRNHGGECDGFITDVPGVMPIIRVADCVPILMAGKKGDGFPAVGAFHGGWRGTASGIVCRGVRKLIALGAESDKIQVAIGAHIGVCCFEVGEDMLNSVISMQGRDFAERYIKYRNSGNGTKKLTADLSGMNTELLLSSGIRSENIDVSDECTCCKWEKFHSHRKTGGRRGAMGAGIVICMKVPESNK